MIESKLDSFRPGDLKNNSEEEPICRICHENQDENEEALISPCECQGSLRYVHASCMDRWRMINLNVPELRNRCQLCLTEFRLSGASPFSRQGIWNALASHKGVYDALIRTISTASLVPLSFGALMLSSLMKRDDLYVSGPADIHAKPWKEKVFGYIIRASILAEINKFIRGCEPREVSRTALLLYGLTKLGSYGCTCWLFTDGMAHWIPIHTNQPDGERRPSPALAILKAVVEFYVVPFCLRTPDSITRLPFFLGTTIIGLVYVVKQVESRLRKSFLSLLPYCKHLELGTLATD